MFRLQYGELVIVNCTERSALQLCVTFWDSISKNNFQIDCIEHNTLIDECNITDHLGIVIWCYSQSKEDAVGTDLDLAELASW
jgi:hypothetical protein